MRFFSPGVLQCGRGAKTLAPPPDHFRDFHNKRLSRARNMMVRCEKRPGSMKTFFGASTVTNIQQQREIFSAIVELPFGKIGVRTASGLITELCYLPPHFDAKDAGDATAAMAVAQLQAYCDDADYRFDLPLKQAGTDFQQQLLDAGQKLEQAGVQVGTASGG